MSLHGAASTAASLKLKSADESHSSAVDKGRGMHTSDPAGGEHRNQAVRGRASMRSRLAANTRFVCLSFGMGDPNRTAGNEGVPLQ
ncbi:hypothetical protein NA8A_09898 [Nitratireductor indicus C115]|uniref:Uncharacterized protein n=1 Tax=Nitratireductor indicus C115 TaxID=1231190 RepID=K2NSP3_9HYPH|nr:hypothetical protein NA8A_09898 [Nitratireductor indicus C115]